MSSFVDRIIGAAKLDAETYNEIREDPSALAQAILLLLIFGLLDVSGEHWGPRLGSFILSLANWSLGVGLIWIFGKRIPILGQETPTLGQLFRTTTFSLTVLLIAILPAYAIISLVPVAQKVVGMAIIIWFFSAFVVSIRVAFRHESLWYSVGLLFLPALLLLLVGLAAIAILYEIIG